MENKKLKLNFKLQVILWQCLWRRTHSQKMRHGFTLLNQFLQLTPSTKWDLFIGGILICNFIGSLSKGFWFFWATHVNWELALSSFNIPWCYQILCFAMFLYTYRDNLPKNGSKPLPNFNFQLSTFNYPRMKFCSSVLRWLHCTANVACIVSLCYSMDLVLEETLYFSTGISSQIIYFWIVKYVVKFCFCLFCFGFLFCFFYVLLWIK